MTSLKNTQFKTSDTIRWPRHLTTPSELIKALGEKSRLNLIRSPLCSKIILQIVGSWAYLVARVLNKSEIHNHETFNLELKRLENQTKLLGSSDQPTGTGVGSSSTRLNRSSPLLTFSNHISCIDDPVLWASLLPLTYYSTNTNTVRWSPAALEICFSKPWHSTFFSLGKTFPILRGAGLDQPAMDFAKALLKCNQWLHLFPEGKVMRDDNQQVISNKERGYIFKWGISKLILDHFESIKNEPSVSGNAIRILPFYHLGLDEILPIGWPYIPRIGKKITVYIRPEVIKMDANMLRDILNNRRLPNQSTKSRSNDKIRLIKLTNYLEEEFEKLIDKAHILHLKK